MTTKERILQLALEAFAREGYENTGVAQIVSTAQVTKPTLYHHFGSKEGLLEAMITSHGAKLMHLIDEALFYKGDLHQSLTTLIQGYITFARANPDFFRLYKQLYQSPKASPSKLAIDPFYDQVCQRVIAFFGEVANQHTNLEGKTTWMAYSLLGLMDTYVLYDLDQEEEALPTQTLSRNITQQFLYGVF